MVEFLDRNFSTTPFHIIFPDTNTGYTRDYYYQIGFYNLLTKDCLFKYYAKFTRNNPSWISNPLVPSNNLTADITGRAGSYRNNVKIVVFNPAPSLGLSELKYT